MLKNELNQCLAEFAHSHTCNLCIWQKNAGINPPQSYPKSLKVKSGRWEESHDVSCSLTSLAPAVWPQIYNSIGQLDLCQSCQSNEIFSPTEIVGLSRLRFERHWKICASSWATAQPCSAREPLTSRPRQGLSWHFSIGQIFDSRLAKPVPIYFQQLIPETMRVFHQAEKSLQSLWANRDVIAQFICLSSRSSWPHTKATATCSVCTVYMVWFLKLLDKLDARVQESGFRAVLHLRTCRWTVFAP
jgi:hypothetical protein